jgi:hypothetical protein
MAIPSLWHYIQSLPSSMEMQILAGLGLSGTLGMLANWLTKWARNEVGCLRDYIVSTPRRTVLSLLTFAGAALTTLGTGIFFAGDGHFVGWLNVLWIGATTGFGIDAVVNKAEREQWTEAQRAAKTVS